MSDLIKKHPLPVFFILAFVFTWIGSLIHYFSAPDGNQILSLALGLPGALIWYYGPFLGAVIVTRVSEGQGSLRRFLKRLLIWRVGWRWYAFIVLYPLALHLAVVGIDWLLGKPAPTFFHADGVPSGNILFLLFGLIVYQIFVRGIGEETGWRGFALPRLQSHHNPLTASLILGALWALWHIHPANFSAMLSPGGIFVLLNIFASTLIFTWLYNHTQGSVLIAILFHMTLNIAEYIVPIGITNASLTRQILQISLVLSTAVLLLITSDRQTGKEISS